MSINEKPKKQIYVKSFAISTFLVSDYLLISRLLNGDSISWEESKVKILSSRVTNHASNVRKLIGNFDCIKNEVVNTETSYYEKYTLNPNYKESFQTAKNKYESNPIFMKRLNKKLEKINRSI